ncbi:MAG: chemotaxis-specific protein-glutamate methyltransferase CheB [Pseudomonadota bacterium]
MAVGAEASGHPPRRVVVVDDNRTIRALLRALIGADPRLDCVGEAADPYEAREVIKATNPDVLTLDVEMPKMNGLKFLENLMRLRPMPVVMVSSRTTDNSAAAIEAMALGAIDCVSVMHLQGSPEKQAALVETLVTAANATVQTARAVWAEPARAMPVTGYDWDGRIVAIGSSTGGVEAIETVLRSFPADGPPVLIAQHMPPKFIQSLVERLDARLAPDIRVVDAREKLQRGTVYFGPGGEYHIGLSPRDPETVCRVPADGTESYVPEVNILFRSALPHARRILGVVLSGMGRDGADGLLALRTAGARTIVQDGATAVIDGMPKSARDLGAAETVLPLGKIGDAALARCSVGGGVRA